MIAAVRVLLCVLLAGSVSTLIEAPVGFFICATVACWIVLRKAEHRLRL